MKDDESSIRSGPTCYTGDPPASDLGNRSAAGTDWEWATTKIWARLRDLVTVNSHIEAVGQDRLRSCSSVQTLARSHNIKSNVSDREHVEQTRR